MIVGKSVAMVARSSVSMPVQNCKVTLAALRNCSMALAAQMDHCYSLLAAD